MCKFQDPSTIGSRDTEGGGGLQGAPPPQSQIDQKKPSLNRVKLPEIVLSKTTKGKYKGGIRNVG